MNKGLIVSAAACLCLLLLAAPASALPLLDGDAGVRYWSAKPSGDISYKGDNLDLEDNLDFEREGVPSVYARAQIPLLMLEARYTRLDYSGNAENITTSTDDFGTITLNNDASTETTMDILHGGAMFSVPLPLVDLGLGAGVSYIDAEAEVESSSYKETASAEAPLPVAKARAEFSPPIEGLDFAVSGEGLMYSGNAFYDLRGTVGYTLLDLELVGLRVEGGYRHIRIDFDEEDLVLDANFSGPFAGVSVSF